MPNTQIGIQNQSGAINKGSQTSKQNNYHFEQQKKTRDKTRKKNRKEKKRSDDQRSDNSIMRFLQKDVRVVLTPLWQAVRSLVLHSSN
ncbi:MULTISPECIES: hypothetical protein [unclassified Okeania]|uniref:hypothetical protein n=1 Tax=unclassified Okeania TaxID=2634635 RepID=UPI0013BFA049|nr:MULTISPECIES: hypothetical protein [unclassified Okeania]NEO56648.1 hypothetical protein [Okeania sp. SIO3B5]NET42681.1 hypothetical protein [Okeania sp. SIO2B3]